MNSEFSSKGDFSVIETEIGKRHRIENIDNLCDALSGLAALKSAIYGMAECIDDKRLVVGLSTLLNEQINRIPQTVERM